MPVRLAATLALLTASAFAFSQDAGDAKYEETLVKLLETMGQMTKTLEMIVDEPSAKAQRAPLKEQVEVFLKTRKESESLAPPSADVRDKLAQKFRPEFEKSRKTLVAQIARVQRVPGGTATLQDLRDIFEKKSK
jgi:hypothetical protein